MSGAVEGVDRNDLPHHEQMLDAQARCVPCKLCGGEAVITDAGRGAGYYIQCGNSVSFHDYKGCLINERRLGGWAYNVMDWWNRLHALTTPPARSYADGVEDAAKVADDLANAAASLQAALELHGVDAPVKNAQRETATTLAAAIRILSQEPQP